MVTHTTRVLVAGTFDRIHLGHESFLAQAKALGDELVVIVSRDQTVQRLKGHAPQRSEMLRLAAVHALPMVSDAVLGSNSGDYLAPVVVLQPDVLALGYDQWPNEAQLRQQLADRGLLAIRIVRLKPLEPDRYHSSLLQPES